MLVTSEAHRQIGVRCHRLWGIEVFGNRISFLRAGLSKKAWGRGGIHLVLCRMAWRGGEGRSPRQSAIGSVHMWHENAQLPFLHLNPNNCDCHCLWFGNSAEQTVGCIGVPTFIFMITLDLHHELNFWLVLWRILVIFPMFHNVPLWWKPKSFLVQVFQVPKPHPSPAFFLFWVSWIHIFFFYSITTAFSQASLPLGLSELDYHGLCHCYSQLLSITHSLRASEMCTLFDPLILFLKTHHSRTFLCHSFFHLFTWCVLGVLPRIGARQR